ncbi:choice-of-anchor A family protein [Lactobacillus helveticus]|nr:choice-of-anchor A family protein [Lactobacillus helveticus]
MIDVSEAIKNTGDSKETIYVTVDASHISGDNKRNITIKGIPAGEDAPIIILNVTNVQNGDLTVKTHLVLEYSDQNNVNGSSEKHDQANKLLWNFSTNLNSLNIAGDYHLGSILASNAHIITNVTMDGNIIGYKVTIKGESHRWDLVPPMDEIQIPEEPEKPTPDPEPQPENPTSPPTDEELPPSEEDFVRPLPENVVKSTTNKVQEQATQEKATPQTSPSTVVETSTEKEIALPETGKKQNKLISIGAMMSAVATAILSLGLIIQKKTLL